MLMNLNDCLLNSISKSVEIDRTMRDKISAQPKLMFRYIDTHAQELVTNAMFLNTEDVKLT